MKFLKLVVGASIAVLIFLLMQMSTTPKEAASASDGQPAATMIRGVRVFDGERVWPKADVVVRDGRIQDIGEHLAMPADAEIVEGQGRTLLPGLIDAHVHAWGDARKDALRFGVTTELDMFTDFHQLADARRERESLAATDRADLWSAGTLATAPGGHGTEYGMQIPTLTTPAEAPAWVAARKAEGSDYIKIVREDLHVYTDARKMPTLDAATAAALIAAAHAQGLKAVVHASAQEQARESLRDGIDGLVHVFQDAPADDALIQLAKRDGVFFVPTLTVVAGFAGEKSTLATDPRIAPFLSAAQTQTLASRLPIGDANPALIANARESVRRLHAAGVMLLAGTDAPNPHTAHGAALHEEIAQLVAAGLSPQEALKAATSLPAKAFGLSDRGRIARDLRADLVLVDGDPTTNIEATRAIVTIWKNGRRVDRDPAAKAVAVAAPAYPPGVISGFDQDLAAKDGGQWMPTTDEMAGGSSKAELVRIDGGAAGSAGALRMQGEVVLAGSWPWAGAMLHPGTQPMQPVDVSSRQELVFQARGDGREYSVMVFSGNDAQARPSIVNIHPGKDWQTLRLPLADFAGADLRQFRAVAITAGAPAGHFQLDVDAVEIR
ncbi:CIA30 family protein [Arenimonas oryziterrae]|uniref:Amidohydrolase-related domain-containing protein n=1 Tax=Arenimonas oryziterrae DSM 21050 = YC6267 TaxID=1121015 RepID=A0A091AZT8_9GAMM|nr:CIA30 family protein [Arenimonas oryziterrae]KFN44926.1 hypothetical protein N789_02585 [Arenimonas oryziterrae DSM 21050 = YC6267]